MEVIFFFITHMALSFIHASGRTSITMLLFCPHMRASVCVRVQFTLAPLSPPFSSFSSFSSSPNMTTDMPLPSKRKLPFLVLERKKTFTWQRGNPRRQSVRKLSGSKRAIRRTSWKKTVASSSGRLSISLDLSIMIMIITKMIWYIYVAKVFLVFYRSSAYTFFFMFVLLRTVNVCHASLLGCVCVSDYRKLSWQCSNIPSTTWLRSCLLWVHKRRYRMPEHRAVSRLPVVGSVWRLKAHASLKHDDCFIWGACLRLYWQ